MASHDHLASDTQPADSPSPRLGFEDGHVLDPERRTLHRDGEPVHLTGKTFDCLVALVEGRDRVMTRAELMDAVWPDTFVEEANLTQNISVLRKALGGGARDPRFIVTVPGRGYRFVATVRLLDLQDEDAVGTEERTEEVPQPVGTSTDATHRRQVLLAVLVAALVVALAAWWATDWPGWRSDALDAVPATTPFADEAGPTTLAVLPFGSLGVGDSGGGDDVLGIGLADAVINRLSGVGGVVVRPTAAVLPWADATADPREVGRSLQVDALLTGTVQQAADRLRVSAQLVRTADAATLWAGTFDRPAGDLFAMQDTVSRELAAALAVELAPGDAPGHTPSPGLDTGPGTVRADAYRAYLEGRIRLVARTGDAMAEAETSFRRATALDPSYALAWVGLADALLLQGFYGARSEPPRRFYERAEEAARQALALDPSLGDAHAALGWVAMNLHHDLAASEASFRRALELRPGVARIHQWHGWSLLAQGRVDASRAALERARELDPVAPIRATALAMHAYYTGDLDGAERILRDTLVHESDFGRAHLDLGLVLEADGRIDEALLHYRRAAEILGPSDEVTATLGHLQGRHGDRQGWEDAMAELQRRAAERPVPAAQFAMLHLAVDAHDDALAALEQGLRDASLWPVELRYDPRYDRLRNAPRFRRLLASAGMGSGPWAG